MAMVARKGENRRSVNILLFLNIAFFCLQIQDPQRYAMLFGFDRQAVMAGQVWRLFSYQFVQAWQLGSLHFYPALTLFLNLVLLGVMGTAVEEEWGTFHFTMFYLLSSLGSAFVAGLLNIPLLGSF